MQTLYRFKGTVTTVGELENIENRVIGDVYKCEADLHDYIWNGQDWVDIGQNVDFTEIMQKVEELEASQQDLIDDMSKTYTGTNITAPTVAGFGRINKLYGHTIEEGTGEKSPTNPYVLKCVGFLKELSRVDLELGATNGTTGALISNNTRLRTKELILLEAGTYTIVHDKNYIVVVQKSDANGNYIAEIVSWSAEPSFTLTEKSKIRVLIAKTDGSDMSNISSINIQIARPVEIISKNGEQQSSNVVVTKPLCCLKDGDNIIAQDYIDYGKGVVHRECGYISSYNNETISTQYISSTGSLTAGATVVYKLATSTEELIDCSNKIVQYGEQTTVSNRDGAKIEVSLTNNEAISGLNENIDNVESKVNKMSNYTTQEQVIGTWINDKPIYRKVIEYKTTETIGSASGTTNTLIPHGISDLDRIINNSMLDSSDTIYPVSGSNSSNVPQSAKLNYYTNTAVNFRVINTTITARTFYIILEYTKTTD